MTGRLHHLPPPPRWTTAIHEAGHVVAAAALGGDPVGAESRDDGNGVALHGRRLLSRDAAIVYSSGPLAEQLFSGVPAPTARKPDPLPALPPAAPGREAERTTIGGADSGAISDHQGIIQYCCGLEGSGPAYWAARHERIHTLAREILERHRAAVVEVAEATYLSGFVLPSALDPILRRHGLLREDQLDG